MKFSDYLNESETKVQPKTKKELERIISNAIREKGYDCDLNFIDTNLISDMSDLFNDIPFNGDISKWNVSNVKNMDTMFSDSNFNRDISNWNVSNVEQLMLYRFVYKNLIRLNSLKFYLNQNKIKI